MKLSQKLKLEHDSGDCGESLEGFAEMAEALENSKPKIKMTKKLPSEAGQYYWSLNGAYIELQDVENCMINKHLCCYRAESGILSIEKMGGYWAKVDESMFEFEGE